MVQLMSGLGYKFTVISAVLWSFGLLLPLVTCVTKVTKHEFEIDYIQKDISWLHCPEGWQKIGTNCILINVEHASFSEATTICRSYGGHLVKIQGFNPNQGFGELAENFISKLNQEYTNESPNHGGLRFWIGLKRNGYGNYSWSDGEVAQVYEGFWSLGQPLGFQQGFEQCCYMDVNIYNEYGNYRWSLGSCETRLPFLCEVTACVAGQYRCADGKKCISPTWLCDGVKDCLDESDELDCIEKCGGYLTGTQGSFHSPNYPHSYPHYSFCHWKIEVPAGKRIKLEFEFFSVEDKYDTISVYDGSSSTDPLLVTYTGDSASQVPLSKSNYLVVIFSSDHDGAKQGFNVTWQAVTYESCGGNLVADKDVRYFTSPEYPQKYSDNLLCDWIISNPDPGKVVSLQFETFSLEDENDWVEIRDGELDSSPLFIRYTGAVDMATVFVSSGNKLFVRLKTDSVHRGSGFNASFQSGCDVTVSRGYATIFSPGYDLRDYPSNVKCSWSFAQFENKELALVFTDFDTEENFDSVVVYDGIQEGSANIIGEFSGKNVPSPVRSKEILVKFQSDNQVQRSGWKAVVSYDCPSLYPLPSYSFISTAVSQEYSAVVQYSCDIGYHINGPNSIICDIGGKWNASAPTCNIINCGSPLIPKNGGLLSLNSTLFGGVALYRCNLGYTLLGNHIVSCTEYGWTDYPSCEAISCPKIAPPMYGNIIKSSDHNSYGAVVEYSCYPHYRMDGRSLAYCSEDGQWSNQPPVCLSPVCPELFISYGYINVSDLVEAGDYVGVMCNHGYQVKGSDVIFCNMTGSYDSEIPVCQDINECDLKDTCDGHFCQNLPGIYQCKCKEGYQHLHGNKTTCVLINECSVNNGGCAQICKDLDGGYTCDCNYGYHLYRGDNSVMIAGQILVPNKTCIITCPRLNINNGGSSVSNTTMLHDGSFIYPTSISIICPKGHLPNGPENIVCLQNGTWSSLVTSCEAQSCPPLLADHSDVLYSHRNRSADSVATYRCKEGYELIGNKYRHCILSKNTLHGNRMYAWTGSDPKCQAMDCGSLPDPSFGKVLYNTTTYGSQAEYRCQCGYQLTGSKVRVCQQNRLWSGTNAICSLATCSHPGNPAFGSVKRPSSSPHYIGSMLEFQCDRKGYQLTDASPLRCDITKLPSLQLMLEMNYLASTNVSNTCVDYYGYLAAEYLKQTLNQPNVTARCSQHSMLQMVEASNYIGSAKGKMVTLNVAMTIGSTSSSVDSTCLCGRNIIATLNSDVKWLTDLLQIPGNTSLSCPVVNLHPQEISEHGRKWLCPDTYGLIGTTPGAVCSEDSIPTCVRMTTDDCLLESPVPMTTESPLSTSTVMEDSTISTPSSAQPVTTTPSLTGTTSISAPDIETTTTSVMTSSTDEITSTKDTTTDKLTDKPTTESAVVTSTQVTQTTTGNDTAETTVIATETTTTPSLSTTDSSTATSTTESITTEQDTTTYRTTTNGTTTEPPTSITDSTTTDFETTESVTATTTTASSQTDHTTEKITTTVTMEPLTTISSSTTAAVPTSTATEPTTTTKPEISTSTTTETPVSSSTTARVTVTTSTEPDTTTTVTKESTAFTTESATTSAITTEPVTTTASTTTTTKTTTTSTTESTSSATEPTTIASTESTSTESTHTGVTTESLNITTEGQPSTSPTTETMTTTAISTSSEKPSTSAATTGATESVTKFTTGDTTSTSPTTTTGKTISVSTEGDTTVTSPTSTSTIPTTAEKSTITMTPTTSVSTTADQSTTTTLTSVPTTTDKSTTSTMTPTSTTQGPTLPPQTDPWYYIRYSGEITGDTSQSSCISGIISIVNTGIEDMKGTVERQLSNIKSCKGLTSIRVSGGTNGFNSSNIASFTVNFGLPKTSSISVESCGNSLKSYIDGKISNVFEAKIQGSATCSGLSLNSINFIQQGWDCEQGYELDIVNNVCDRKVAETTTEVSQTTAEVSTTKTLPAVTTESVTTTETTTSTTPVETTTTPETTTTTPEMTTTLSMTTTSPTTTSPVTTTSPTTTTSPMTTTTKSPMTTTTKSPMTTTTTTITAVLKELPFYLLKTQTVFDGSDIQYDNCRINLSKEIQSVIQQAANDINNNLRIWPTCNTTKDITVLPRDAHLAIKLQLNLTVPFAIQSKSVGFGSAVESCAKNNVEQYLMSRLQSDLTSIPANIRSTNCSDVSLSTFTVTSGWECPDGYELEAQAGICSLIPATSATSTTELPSTSTLETTTMTTTSTTTTVISTLPPGVRISYKPSVLTDFNVSFLTDDAGDECLLDYKNVLTSLLKQQTGLININSQVTNNCQNVYVDLVRDISVSLSQRQCIITVELYATSVSITKQDLQTCNAVVAPIILSGAEALFGNSIIQPSAGGSCTDQLTIQSVGLSNVTTLCPHGSSMLQTDLYFICIADNSSWYEFVGQLFYEFSRRCVNEQHVLSMIRDKTDSFVSNVANNITQNRQCTQDIVITQSISVRKSSFTRNTASLKFELRSLHENFTNLESCARAFMSLAQTILGDTLRAEVGTLCPTKQISELQFTSPQYKCPLDYSWNETEKRCEMMASRKRRRRRSTAAENPSVSTQKLNLAPSWNASLPQCTDIEAPVFQNCSSDPIYINVGHGGIIPVEIPLPVANDNSGLPPYYTYLPEDFRLPYLFRNNGTNVTVIATDAGGNQNNCTFVVLFRDINPPNITCPSIVVIEQYNVTMDTDYVRPKFENTGVQSLENIEYKLHPGSGLNLVKFGDHVNVTATAYDESGNNASCSFTYEAQKVTYPNYNFSFTFSVKNVECDEGWHNTVWSELLDLLQQGCRRIYDNTYNILESEIRVHNNGTKEMVEAKAWIEVRKLNQSPLTIKDCANKAIEEVRGLKADNLNINCSNVEVQFVGVTSENFTCDDDGILQENTKLCVHCTKGSYPDPIRNQCRPCPSPEDSDLVPHNSCQLCTGAMATDKSKCLDECQAGEYSPTGYQPCLKCATGTYSDHTKAEICIACLPGKTTLKSGSTSSHDCKEICPVGYFGFLGLGKCELCPENFYSSGNGSSRCTECPAGTVTTKSKNTSPSDCKVVDHCERYGCENGGRCHNTDQGRSYRCICPPGYIGEHCQITVDGCLSHPCVNGGICSKNDNDYICKCDSGYTGKNCETLIDNCVNEPCQNGFCINHHFSFQCMCHFGFTGERCDVNIDDCSHDPCNNGGRCIDLINDYSCNCTSTGYYGRNCGIKIDDCNSSSCLNGGACHDRSNGFECSCSHGFTGLHCEINIDDCVSDFCKNGGVCIDGVNSYSCLCQPGFSGQHCENNIDDCKTNPCKNDGTCEDRDNDFYCHCQQGYEGKLCEVNHDDCLPYPCNMETSVSCIDGLNNFTCGCLSGWMGDHCERPINECESSPCQHGGTCYDGNHGYSCKCKEGYKGYDCSVDVDECESFPCYNRGQCINNDGNFTCRCLPGFEGRLCQRHIDQCQSSPCKNGGSCHDVIEDFTCLCPAGWTGQLCDKNIDECKSQPCLNGATCHDGLDDFNCTCRHGYEGKACDKDIDECSSNPCQNGATCVDEVGRYRCQCVQGFTGMDCQISESDECVNDGGCKNGGTCVQGRCQCPPLYTGPDCGKEKSADFDLFFHGVDGSRCQTPIANVKDTSQFSVCLWVRFAVAGSIGTVLTVLEDSGRTADEELREMLHITEDRVLISYFDNLQKLDIQLPINDGHWHHVCYTWSSQSGHWSLYRDGIVFTESEGYGQGQQMPERQRILLGQAAANIDGPRQFHGELSQLNVYNKALESTLIKSMATNCSNDRHPGDRHQWAEFSSYIEQGIDVVIPTICGSSKCPPGFRGSLCNIPIDKEPPVVTFCPGDIRIISKDRLNIINWTEPLFGDNNGVEDIVKTHRPGQVFAYGEYNVNYVAFDAENNTASCTFKIFVLPYNCTDPPASKNTIKACGTWRHGIYCKISCIDPDRYAFTETVPQVYRCGQEGFWDPPRGQIFTFPSCAAVSTASVTIQGQLELKGPFCTDATKDNLTRQFVKVMKDLDSTLDLCPTEDCDYSKINIECGSGSSIPVRRRKKRAVNDDVYKIVFDIPINGSIANVGDESTLQFQTMVKSGDLDTGDFTVDQNSVVIETEATCEEGQVLEMNNKCVNCPVGTYYNNNTRSCELCPIGQFSNLEKQTSCQNCPYGNTTETTGATDITDCYDICINGSYYEEVTRRCELCPTGYYQSEAGMKTCQYCSNGQTTVVQGATSIDQCQDGCNVGSELATSGYCQPCIKGTYKDNISLASCLTCPYGYTTESYGSYSLDQCSIVECEPGHRRDTKDDTCKLCPRGTYQPFREQDFCFICGKGQTTKYPGSTQQSSCYEGPVNECEIEHNCHVNASCIDTEDGYNCTCKVGYRGNSTYCALDKCKDYCKNGDCNYDNNDKPVCNCHQGFTGQTCDTSDVSMPYGVIGGVCAGAVTVMVAIVLLVFCHRKKKKMNDEDYQTLPRIHRHQDTVAYPVSPVPIFNSTLNPTFLSDSDISDPTFPIREMSQGSLGAWSRSDFAVSESSSEGGWRDPSPEQSPTLGHPRVRIRTSDPLGENFQVEDSYF